MSKYTTEVRFICETANELVDSKGYNSVNDIIANSLDSIFDFDYPIFNEEYRKILETKIIKHYYTREIAFETYGLWKLKLDTKLNEIMPYYNQLYKSTMLEFEPLLTEYMTKTHEGGSTKDRKNNVSSNSLATDNGSINQTGNSKSNTDTTSTNTNHNLFSDTPQGALTNVDNETYLSNATKDYGDSTGSNNNTTDTTANTTTENTNNYKRESEENANIKVSDNFTDVFKGYSGISGSKLLNEFRKTFLNIDMQIIDELEELFFQLW